MLATAAACLVLSLGADVLQGVQLLLVGANRSTTVQAQAGGLDVGDIVIRVSGQCGAGFSEVTELNGVTLVGTLAANGNQGGTGGSDSITPAGVNTLAAVADHASHTHQYSQVPNHVHTYASQTATTGAASSYEHGAIDTSSAAAESTISTNNPTGGVATGTTVGPNATLTHQVTQPTFTGAPFDNRPAFRRVIFCSKN